MQTMTNYLTQINVGKPDALTLKIFDNYRWHQVLYQAFPEKSCKRNFLFRVEDRGAEYQIFMLSPKLPVNQPWGIWQTKVIADTFLSHKSYLFQLRANPVRRKRILGEKRGSGYLQAITDETELREWLNRQGGKNGFRIDLTKLQVMPPVPISFCKNNTVGTVNQADFSGVLDVADSQLFAQVFSSGIGRAKSLGFGMLMLRAVK
jgi:CRISPR-associated protein Cas6/Cse3/CasE subtype I-E